MSVLYYIILILYIIYIHYIYVLHRISKEVRIFSSAEELHMPLNANVELQSDDGIFMSSKSDKPRPEDRPREAP